MTVAEAITALQKSLDPVTLTPPANSKEFGEQNAEQIRRYREASANLEAALVAERNAVPGPRPQFVRGKP